MKGTGLKGMSRRQGTTGRPGGWRRFSWGGRVATSRGIDLEWTSQGLRGSTQLGPTLSGTPSTFKTQLQRPSSGKPSSWAPR